MADWIVAGSVGAKPVGELTNRQRITAELKDALERLAAHYDTVDRARRDAARRLRMASAPKDRPPEFTAAERARVAAMEAALRNGRHA